MWRRSSAARLRCQLESNGVSVPVSPRDVHWWWWWWSSSSLKSTEEFSETSIFSWLRRKNDAECQKRFFCLSFYFRLKYLNKIDTRRSILIVVSEWNDSPSWANRIVETRKKKRKVNDRSIEFVASFSSHLFDRLDDGTFDHLCSKRNENGEQSNEACWISTYFFKERTQFRHVRRVDRETLIGITILKNETRRDFLRSKRRKFAFVQQIFHHS